MERLRESYIFDTDQYTRLTEEQIQHLHINKPRLTESTLSMSQLDEAATQIKASLKEEDQKVLNQILNQIREKGLDNSFKVWKLPIGKYGNVNGNKRIYTKKLWENVRDRQHSTWKGFCGLCDHPEKDNDPGEFKNQAVIWHDMEVPESGGTVFGYGSFVGPYGHLAQEILEHGGRVGTSSSGFGDVDKYTKEVDPETYIIERLADLVLNPSQGTFGTGDCSHSAGEFMNDVHRAATIEFGKQPVREQVENNEGVSKIMKDNALKHDAAANQNQTQTPAADSAGSGAAANVSAPTQDGNNNNNTMRESMEHTDKAVNKLTKIEEKAFRKYVETFMNAADKINNPIQRLNECMDILNCFDEGNCPDLRESLEKKLLEEKDQLESLVEKVVKTEADFGMNITQFREAAERNTAQGILLNEQVLDYKQLCESLQARNKQLSEDFIKLQKTIKIKDKLTEKKLLEVNKEVVGTTSQAEELKEKNRKLSERNSVLMERISKLQLTNSEFEKENGLLSTKLKEAAIIIKGTKQEKLTESQTKLETEQNYSKLMERVKELTEENKAIKDQYAAQSERFDKLTESFDAYKKEIADTYNPVAHMMPKFEERVGKYLNLRESKGIEVENYWSDLLNKYGESVTPFEQQIRGSKTLKEATNSFLKYRTQIDPDFKVAQPAEFAYRNRTERSQLYEHQGIVNPVDSYRNASLEDKNADFMKQLKAQGLN